MFISVFPLKQSFRSQSSFTQPKQHRDILKCNFPRDLLEGEREKEREGGGGGGGGVSQIGPVSAVQIGVLAKTTVAT